MLHQALISGIGIGPFSPSLLAELGNLVDVLPHMENHIIPYYTTFHKRMERSPKVKAFVKYLEVVGALRQSK